MRVFSSNRIYKKDLDENVLNELNKLFEEYSSCKHYAYSIVVHNARYLSTLSNTEKDALLYSKVTERCKQTTPYARNTAIQDAKGIHKSRLALIKEQKDIFGADEALEPSFEAIYDLLLMRTTTGPFITFLKGKHEKAIRKLSKQKKLFGYESRVLKLWKAGERFEISRLSFVTENLKLLGDDGTSNGDVKELGGLFLAWLVITPLTSAFFLGLFLLLMWIEKIGSVYLMGPMYNLPFCFCFGFLTAIALSYFARFAVYKLISKKNYKKNREMDSVQNGAGADKLMKGFAVVLTIAGMIGCLLTVKHNINFLPDGFIDNSKLLSLKGEFHSYDDIKRVYYKADRENDFGETLDFPSFVIVLQNGKEIDLYEHGDIEDYEERLKVLFEEHGIQVEQSDSQKNSH